MEEFKFTEEQLMLRDTIRDFVNSELKPVAAKIDQDEKNSTGYYKKTC